MTSSEQPIDRIMDSVRDGADSGLEAVRKFLDTVNGIFPDVGDDGPRRRIIDSAFKMTGRCIDDLRRENHENVDRGSRSTEDRDVGLNHDQSH
jgi:hypothetical protein